jgi:hypothetical protein
MLSINGLHNFNILSPLIFLGSMRRVSGSLSGWQKALDSAYYKLTLILAGIPNKTKAIGFCSALNTNNPAKMSTEPNKEESDKKNTEKVEVKIVPEGTFGGTIEKPILYKEGEPIPEDTGDQGGGQN